MREMLVEDVDGHILRIGALDLTSKSSRFSIAVPATHETLDSPAACGITRVVPGEKVSIEELFTFPPCRSISQRGGRGDRGRR
jgi:hypothetical protein